MFHVRREERHVHSKTQAEPRFSSCTASASVNSAASRFARSVGVSNRGYTVIFLNSNPFILQGNDNVKDKALSDIINLLALILVSTATARRTRGRR